MPDKPLQTKDWRALWILKRVLAGMDKNDQGGGENTEMTAKPTISATTKKKLFNPVIIPAWCKSCGICSAFCPKNVIGVNEMGAPVIERPDDCIGCRFCELHCPDFAITIKERKDKA
jgi:2-oxoglutarate ferredoxin oxidoreductase subunit delta